MLCSIDDFVVNVKINFCWRQTKCIDDQDKFQSVKDTDNEFPECQAPRKAPINRNFTCQLTRISENFKEQYFRGIENTI